MTSLIIIIINKNIFKYLCKMQKFYVEIQ